MTNYQVNLKFAKTDFELEGAHVFVMPKFFNKAQICQNRHKDEF